VQAGPASGPASIEGVHRLRDTNAYPPTTNITGIINNIPNIVLIITISIPPSFPSGAGFSMNGGGCGDPELDVHCGSAGSAWHRPVG
jgi:hypothetical protein